MHTCIILYYFLNVPRLRNFSFSLVFLNLGANKSPTYLLLVSVMFLTSQSVEPVTMKIYENIAIVASCGVGKSTRY